MNRISGPAGLPHSCADMVRPSGVFTAIGFYFRSCPKPGLAIATNKAAATVILVRRQPHRDIVMANLPLFYIFLRFGELSMCADTTTVRKRRGLITFQVLISS